MKKEKIKKRDEKKKALSRSSVFYITSFYNQKK